MWCNTQQQYETARGRNRFLPLQTSYCTIVRHQRPFSVRAEISTLFLVCMMLIAKYFSIFLNILKLLVEKKCIELFDRSIDLEILHDHALCACTLTWTVCPKSVVLCCPIFMLYWVYSLSKNLQDFSDILYVLYTTKGFLIRNQKIFLGYCSIFHLITEIFCPDDFHFLLQPQH